jgi:organic radical activating enzyme
MNKLKTSRHGNKIKLTCNYNCHDCQTFSNYNFTGHQLWKDYKNIYARWAEKLDTESWQLLGGEPTLNPTFGEWIAGFRELWPNATASFSTNGTTITPKNKKLYDLLLKHRVDVRYMTHNKNRWQQSLDDLHNWLEGPIESTKFDDVNNAEYLSASWLLNYANIKAESWPECKIIDDWAQLPEHIKTECLTVFNLPDPIATEDNLMGVKLVDVNGVTVFLQNSDRFGFHNTFIPLPDFKSFKVHNSDPLKAHNVCPSRCCHNWTNGKLYKCHQVAHFVEFAEQFDVMFDNIDDETLFRSYKPATSDMSLIELQEFFDNLHNPIPQCKFCPETAEWGKIQASTKKIFFQKKTNAKLI